MGTSRSLPVVMPSIPGQRWSCHSCGHCCRSLVIHLFEEDRRKIDRQAWSKRLGIEPYGRAGRSWVLNKRPDGACVFLEEDNRCKIHAEFGEAAKPLACRMFPFSVRAEPRGWRVSLRFDCPSAAASNGQPLNKSRGWLAELVAPLAHDDSDERDVVDFKRGVRATPAELDTLIASFLRWLADDGRPMSSRLFAVSRITTTLGEAALENVRSKRFTELIDLLFNAASNQNTPVPSAPTRRQCGMLRQLVFAHAEHVSLKELRSGMLGSLRKRWQQLGSARRFLNGTGQVPRMPGVSHDVTFATVEAVASPVEPNPDIESMLGRYLAARLSSHSVFGHGYYGWPVFAGFTALWLSVAAAGWLARYGAALNDRGFISAEDLATSLGIVDRAATRLPVLGAVSERIRVRYLSDNDGVARLIWQYAPLEKLTCP